MFEENLFINNNGLRIEGIISYPENPVQIEPAVIFPPHPKLGGDIYNNVVTAVSSGLAEKGFLSGRFNYRGVGKSEMEAQNTALFDYWEKLDSSGDFSKIIDDGKIIVEEMMEISSAGSVSLIGYSFGTKLAAEFSAKSFAGDSVFISPPLSFYDYSVLSEFKGKALFIIAENDICLNEDELKSFIDKMGILAEIEVIKGEDHFYRESEEIVAKIISDFLCR